MIRVALILFLAPIAIWNEANAADYEFSGFGTIGGVYSDSKIYNFRSDMSQGDSAEYGKFKLSPVSNIGGQFNVIFDEKWDAVAQLVYREQDKNNFDALAQLGFVRYKPMPNWQVRAGRTAIDIFQLSDVRDVGIAYPWVVIPNEVYGLVPNRNLDGADVSYFKDFNSVTMTAKLFYGETTADFSQSAYDPIYFEDLTGIKIVASSFDWQVAFRYSSATTVNTSDGFTNIIQQMPLFEPIVPGATALSQELDFSGKRIRYSSIYGFKAFERFELSGELAYSDSDALPVDHVSNGFVNISVPVKSNTFYITYSFTNTAEYNYEGPVLDPVASIPLVFAVEELVTTFRHNQDTWSLGVRHELNDSVALKLQWRKTHVDPKGGSLHRLEIDRTSGPEESFDTFFAAVSFSF